MDSNERTQRPAAPPSAEELVRAAGEVMLEWVNAQEQECAYVVITMEAATRRISMAHNAPSDEILARMLGIIGLHVLEGRGGADDA